MPVITTEFKGPTNYSGSRIRVRSWLKSITVPYNHALNTSKNHKEAAQQLVNQLNADRMSKDNDYLWEIAAGGEMPDGRSYGFVITLSKEANL